MDAMMDARESQGTAAEGGATSRSLQRLQFELALDLSATGSRPARETLARAAEASGADLLCMLPMPDGKGVTAVVRLSDEGSDIFLQVGAAENGFAIRSEAEMDKTLLQLARASVEVLQRLGADRTLRAQLAAA